MSQLKEYIDDTEDFINIKLVRNTLWIVSCINNSMLPSTLLSKFVIPTGQRSEPAHPVWVAACSCYFRGDIICSCYRSLWHELWGFCVWYCFQFQLGADHIEHILCSNLFLFLAIFQAQKTTSNVRCFLSSQVQSLSCFFSFHVNLISFFYSLDIFCMLRLLRQVTCIKFFEFYNMEPPFLLLFSLLAILLCLISRYDLRLINQYAP